MKRTAKTKAIILKRRNIGETDKIVTAFSAEMGKISFRAAGVRRIYSRRSAHLEPFNLVNLVLTDRPSQLNSLSEVDTIDSFSTLKTDLVSTSYGFYLSEVLDKMLPEQQPNQKVFTLLYACLASLDRQNLDEKTRRRKIKEFLIRLFWELGYLPENSFPETGLTAFVEGVAERKVKSKRLIDEVEG